MQEIPTNNGDAMNVRLVEGAVGAGPGVIENTNAIGATGAIYWESPSFTPTKSNISLTAKFNTRPRRMVLKRSRCILTITFQRT